jgi:hypothetical protein
MSVMITRRRRRAASLPQQPYDFTRIVVQYTG